MYQYKGLEDTISAIATPAGSGGIAIVRISGKDALKIADSIFRPKNITKPSEAKGFTIHYGWIIHSSNQEIIDEVLLSVMLGPRSYTAEDVVEISTHGGWAVVQSVLGEVLKAGARLAEPGEFTKRAFLNGRIDLAQAEAVLDVIRARTESFVRVSQNQLKGQLSTEVQAIREGLMSVYTTLEALINFPEDDIDSQTHDDIYIRIELEKHRVENLLATSNNGRLLKEGMRVVLCGKPNVGKSSLLNALLKQQRAIVTHIAGTTRDVLEEDAQIKGIPLNLIDTAGILEPRDLIEEEAIKRSHLYIQNADLVLLVLDNSTGIEEQDRILIEQIKDRNVIVVINKNDLPSKIATASLAFDKVVKVSVIKEEGLESLEEAIVKSIWQGEAMDTHGVLVSNLRHIQAFKQTNLELQAALGLLEDGLSVEFISEHVKTAVNHLDSVLGRNIDDDLLETIFSEFCIGK